MRLLTELLARFPPLESGVLRRLQFYQLMVEIERLKEPSGKQWHALAATSSPLDISFSDKEFVALWQHNVQQTFPKDLCVSLMITDGMKEYPLFVLPFPYFEIRNLDIGTAAGVLKTPLASFSVNLMEADELDLDDEQLRALNLCLNGQTSDLSVLSQAIAETLGPRFTLAAQPLRYALSSGKPVLNNLVAELRTLSRMHSFPDVFQGFLDDRAFENEVRVCRPESLVRLSAMDEAQRNAVANALSSRVSVITGPPGCGKTQVLLNILGNAVTRNLSVLVASTNNLTVTCSRLAA